MNTLPPPNQSYHVGGVVPLTVQCTSDAAGQIPTDATALTLTLRDQASTMTTLSLGQGLTHTGVGAYAAQVVPSLSGRLRYAWAATGAYATPQEGTVNVAVPPVAGGPAPQH